MIPRKADASSLLGFSTIRIAATRGRSHIDDPPPHFAFSTGNRVMTRLGDTPLVHDSARSWISLWPLTPESAQLHVRTRPGLIFFFFFFPYCVRETPRSPMRAIGKFQYRHPCADLRHHASDGTRVHHFSYLSLYFDVEADDQDFFDWRGRQGTPSVTTPDRSCALVMQRELSQSRQSSAPMQVVTRDVRYFGHRRRLRTDHPQRFSTYTRRPLDTLACGLA